MGKYVMKVGSSQQHVPQHFVVTLKFEILAAGGAGKEKGRGGAINILWSQVAAFELMCSIKCQSHKWR